MTDSPDKLRPPPVWRLWDNPILLRYVRSRLRMKGLLPGLLLTVIISAFAFLIAPMSSERMEENRRMWLQERQGPEWRREVQRQMRNADPELRRALEQVLGNPQAELPPPRPAHMHQRMALLPLLAIQALLLFVIGTGQVAGGMTSERDEGMVDYQRLAPMTPLSKTLGYLIGLPAREWVMFLATLPFMGLALWRGQVPFAAWGPVALIFFTSVMLYHLTGLVAGTVFKNRRWSFLICMGMIFLLYFIVPQGARFGLPFLRYMTMWPAVLESSHILPDDWARALREVAAHAPGEGVRFFKEEWTFTDVKFTLIVQGSFILTLLVMVWRKWRQEDSHLLSKTWALLVFAWLCVLPLGTALPAIPDGSLFPARSVRALLDGRPDRPDLWQAFKMCGLYGLMMLILLIFAVLLLTPNRDMQTRGLRRAAKLGKRSAPFLSDEFSAFMLVVMLILAGTASWAWFTRSVLGSHWFDADPGMLRVFLIYFAVLAPVLLGLHALLEARGGRWPFLVIVFCGMVPVLAALIVATASRRSPEAAALTGGASPAVLTYYAVERLMPPGHNDGGNFGVFHSAAVRSLMIWPPVYSAAALLFMSGLRNHWSRLRREGAG